MKTTESQQKKEDIIDEPKYIGQKLILKKLGSWGLICTHLCI